VIAVGDTTSTPSSVAAFHIAVGEAVAQQSGGVPEALTAVVLRGELRSWGFYQDLLDEDTVTTKARDSLRAQWQQAHEQDQAAGWPRYTALVPTSVAEIQASTPPQFAALLRQTVERSGEKPPVLLERAEGVFGRSQLFAMTAKKRQALPTKPAQVQMLGRVCGLNEDCVARLLLVWSQLRTAPAVDAVSTTAAGDVPAVRDAVSGEPEAGLEPARWVSRVMPEQRPGMEASMPPRRLTPSDKRRVAATFLTVAARAAEMAMLFAR
jgi:hypothetical protein